MADEVPNFDDIPSFDALPDAAPQRAAPQQSAGQVPAFDDIPTFDDIPDNTNANQGGPGRASPMDSEGALASGVRAAGRGIIPTAVGLVGAGAGAALGTLAGPVGTVGGGIAGMVAGAAAGEKAQDWIFGPDEQLAADIEAHPAATFVGGMAPALATMNPAAAARPLARVAGAGMMGGLEAVQEGFNEGKFDPGKIALATLAGGVFATPNAVGHKLIGAGERAVPGRPNMAPNPAADQAKVDAGASQAETAGGSAGVEQQPILRDDSSIGNPQSRPRNSRGEEATGKPDSSHMKKPEPGDTSQIDQTENMDAATRAALAGESEGVPMSKGTFANEGAAPPQQPAPDLTMHPPGEGWRPENAPQPTEVGQPAGGTAPKTETVSQPDQRVANTVQDPQGSQGSQVDAGFPQTGDVVHPGANEAIAVSKANAAKPRLGLKKPVVSDRFAANGEPVPAVDEGTAARMRTNLQALKANDYEPALKGKTNHDATEAQKKAGNYEKAGERLLGHDVKYENMKGSTRSGTDAEGKPWGSELPADYGYFKKTTGADKDHMDVYNLRNGDKHFIVDQENLDTGKFDEHKVMANAKDHADAYDTYVKSFSDGKGPARVHDMTEVDADTLKQWLGGHGKSTKKPYGTPYARASKGEPKVVTAAVTKLREAGHTTVADAIEKMPAGEERVVATNKALRMMTNKTGTLKTGELKNARIRKPAPVVEGAFDSEGRAITAHTKGEAAKSASALADVRKVFDQHVVPEKESDADTVARAKRIVDDAGKLPSKYPFKMQVKQEPAMLVRAAKELGMKPAPGETIETKLNEFRGTEKALRSGDKNAIDEVRKEQRAAAEGKMSKLTGDKMVAGAEEAAFKPGGGKNIGDEADAMAERLDAEKARKGAFVEDETDLPPKEIKTAADLKKPSVNDHETAEGRLKTAQFFTKNMEKSDVAKAKQAASAEKTRELMAAQKAAREAKAALGADTAVPKVDLKAAAEARRRNAMEHKVDAEDVEHRGMKDLTGRFLSDESGAGRPGKIWADAKALLKRITPAFDGKRNIPKTALPRTLEPGSPAEYQSYMSDNFKQHDTQFNMHERDVLENAKDIKASVPADKFTQADRNVLIARDEDHLAKLHPGKGFKDLASLSPEEKALHDRLEDQFTRNDAKAEWIRRVDPTAIGPETDGLHVYRIDENTQHSLLHNETGRFRDPLSAVNPLSDAPHGTAKERNFGALERGDGKRFPISLIDPEDGGPGFHVWDHGKVVQTIKDSTFDFKRGDTIDVGGQKLTMGDATIREIEKNIKYKDADGKFKYMKYEHSAIASAAAADLQLTEQMHHMQFVHELKEDQRFKNEFSTHNPNDKRVKDGTFVKTQLGEFDGYFLDKRIAHVMDDYASTPLLGNQVAVQAARNLSTAIMKTMFWNPIIHPLSVLSHYIPARGFDNFTKNPHLLKAFNEVVHYGDTYREILDHGGSLMYSGTVTKDPVKAIFKTVGIAVDRDPAAWDAIAKKLGLSQDATEGAKNVLRPANNLRKAIYEASQKITWASNDMFYMSLYDAHKTALTKSNPSADPHDIIRGAIRATEKDLPNYRVAPELMGSRGLSQFMQDRLASAFGPFHTGVANSYANMVHGMLSKESTGQERVDAAGKLFALAVMGGVLAPLADWAARKVTGNPDTEVVRRSALAVPNEIYKATQGKADPQAAIRRLAMLSPFAQMAIQAYNNKDFGDRPIVQPGDVANAAHGSWRAGARVIKGAGEYAVGNAVQPVGQVLREVHKSNGGLGTGLGDVAGIFTNPSPAARKFDAKAPGKAQHNAVSAYRKSDWLSKQIGFK